MTGRRSGFRGGRCPGRVSAHTSCALGRRPEGIRPTNQNGPRGTASARHRSTPPRPFTGAHTPGTRRRLTVVASCITFRHTALMAKAISVRLDDEAERALRLLESTGLSRSEAIRSSLLASADRMRRRRQLAAEVAALDSDDDDRAEMLAVASLMESLRAAG